MLITDINNLSDIDDVFKHYPELKYIFPKIYEHSKNKAVMKAIIFYSFPYQNYYYNFPPEERAEKLQERFKLTPKDFDIKDKHLQRDIREFEKSCLKKHLQLLRTWDKKLEESSTLLGEVPLSIETYKPVFEIMSNIGKLTKEYLAVEKLCLQEQGIASVVEGGEEESLIEKINQ